MKIIWLVLHIVLAIASGVCTVTAMNTTIAILATISSVLWGINIGMDILLLVKEYYE